MKYIVHYKSNIVMSIICNLLTAVFTVISLPLMGPFFNILFEKTVAPKNIEVWQWNFDTIRAYFIYQFYNFVELQGKELALLLVCGLILSSFFLKNIFRYFSLFFMAPVRNGIIRDLRKQLVDKILDLPLSYFSEERKGDLISRITADVQEVEWSILNVLEAVFREPLIIIGSLSVMLIISPQLTLFVFILIVFTAVVIGGIGKTLRKPSNEAQEKLGLLVSIAEESLSGLRVIKAFNAASYQREKFGRVNNDYRWVLTKLLWRKDLASPLSEFLGITVVAVLLWIGSRQVFSGQLDAATFISFIMAFYYVIDPAKSLTKAVYNIQKGISAMLRIEKVLDAEISIKDPVNPIPVPNFSNFIQYENVSFAYTAGGEQVLRNISVNIPKGHAIAIVGPSGAGKSTFADLLPRFYEVSSGKITIDGIDIKDFTLDQLRSLMGIVTQDPILFNDSIYNNIVFGLENVSEEEVIHAAKIANAHEFIMATENGYQTTIGDRGNKLSGGQKQRITIARAVLKNPPILILDEATSALDSESEKLVQQSLIELMKNRTSIVIAHRLSTIQHADEILVMDQGQIVERGNHASLVELGGTYKKLIALQQV